MDRLEPAENKYCLQYTILLLNYMCSVSMVTPQSRHPRILMASEREIVGTDICIPALKQYH